MSNNNLSPTIAWPDLPDPRDPNTPAGSSCQVNVTPATLEKIAAKHINNKAEPWTECLPWKLINRLSNEVDAQAWRDLSDALATQAGSCLRAPLVVRVRQSWPDRQFKREVWYMPLPTGAFLAIHVRDGSPWLATCFFYTSIQQGRKPASRCLDLQNMLIGRFCIPSPDDRYVCRTMSNPLRIKERLPTGEVRTREECLIAFVIPAHWGISSHSPGEVLRDRKGFRFPDRPPAGSTPGRQRLGPRCRPDRHALETIEPVD